MSNLVVRICGYIYTRIMRFTITGSIFVISVASSIRHIDAIPALLTRWSTAKRLVMFLGVLLLFVPWKVDVERLKTRWNFQHISCYNLLKTRRSCYWSNGGAKLTPAEMVDCFLNRLRPIVKLEHTAQIGIMSGSQDSWLSAPPPWASSPSWLQ